MIQDENIKEDSKLVELSGSNYEIADGEPDIKGWEVKTNQHEKIGKVDDMLFDNSTKSVKYIIVDVDNELELSSKKVLIPIASVELHNSNNGTNNYSETEDKRSDTYQDSMGTFDGENIASSKSYNNSTENNDVVLVPITLQNINNLPAYTKGNVTDANEATISGIFNTSGNTSSATSFSSNLSEETHKPADHLNDATQKLDIIQENLNVEKRTVATGGTRLISRIIEKPVEKTIELKDEHVTVVRTPIDRPVSSTDFDGFKEEQIEMTEYSEVPVVKKEAHVVEEIIVTKDVHEREEIIKETLRNTEVTTEEIKKPKSRKKN